MQRSTSVRRRFGLLASSSLMATTLFTGGAGFAVNFVSPSAALAACSFSGANPTVFTCTGSDSDVSASVIGDDFLTSLQGWTGTSAIGDALTVGGDTTHFVHVVESGGATSVVST